MTAPTRKDADNAVEGRVRHQRSTQMYPRKILPLVALMACRATMGILYYKIAQRAPGEELPQDEQQ